jgi:hypothetical protein
MVLKFLVYVFSFICPIFYIGNFKGDLYLEFNSPILRTIDTYFYKCSHILFSLFNSIHLLYFSCISFNFVRDNLSKIVFVYKFLAFSLLSIVTCYSPWSFLLCDYLGTGLIIFMIYLSSYTFRF